MEPISEEDDTASPESGPSGKIERKQSLSQLQTILQELPPRQREALELKFSAGLSYKEIAEVMEITVTNVGFILHTAIKNVRLELEREEQPAGVRSAQ